jgi:hypothetical protein
LPRNTALEIAKELVERVYTNFPRFGTDCGYKQEVTT